MRTLNAELDSAEKGRQAQIKDYLQVRKSRHDRLSEFVEKVSEVLPGIYQSLSSKSGSFGVGGKAKLVSSGDLLTTPMWLDFCPPGKSWSNEFNSLSGGEQAIATMSFVFSLVKVLRPPLLVMDEVD